MKYLKSNPLIYRGNFKFGTAFSIYDLLQENTQTIESFETPLFFIQGRKDQNVDPISNELYFKNLKLQDKVYTDIEGNSLIN